MNTKISDLQTQGYMKRPYPPELREAVAQTVETWQKFCSLPLETKRLFPYSNAGAGVGYECKIGDGPSNDSKENFDISFGEVEWLRTEAMKLSIPEITAFIEASLEVVRLFAIEVVEFAGEAETAFQIKGFAQEVAESKNGYFLRFIHYFEGSEPDQETAECHTDQSGFTFHLFESAPGAQALNMDYEWFDLPVSTEETVVFPSMQMQLRSDNVLKALCHRVVATPQTKKTGRSSAVLFIQQKHTAKYNKGMFGRLQVLHKAFPGFNYHMPAKLFSRLFRF